MASNDVGSTGDYATLAAWETARQGSNDATETAVLLDEDHANDAGATVSGWTGTCTHVEITGEVAQDGDFTTGARFEGRSSGGFVVVAGEASIAIDISDISVELTGGFYIGLLQGNDGATYDDSLRFSLSRCMVKTTVDNFGQAGVQMHVRSSSLNAATRIGVDVDNCVFVDFASTGYGIEMGYSSAGRQNIDVIARGCTFYNSQSRCGTQHAQSTSSVLFRGCLFRTPGSADAWRDQTTNGTHTFTSDYCLADETSATHSADFSTVTNFTEVTFNDSGTPSSGEVSFTDASNDDFSLVDNANNEALAYVASGSMPTDDILGATRDSTPDAGAFEVVTGGGSGTDVLPTAGTISLTGAQPTVTANVDVAPIAGTISLSGSQPTVSADVVASPTAGTVTLVGSTPAVVADVVATPTAGTITLTGAQPIVSADVLVSPTAGTIALVGQQPEVTGGTLVSPTPGSITLSGSQPLVEADVLVSPTAGTITLVGAQPDVVSDDTIRPTAGTIALTGAQPDVSANVVVSPTPGTLSLSGAQPDISADVLVTPTAGTLTLTGEQPAVTFTGDIVVTPTPGTITLVGAQPSIGGVPTLVAPTAGSVSLTGAQPAVATTARHLVRSALSSGTSSPPTGWQRGRRRPWRRWRR